MTKDCKELLCKGRALSLADHCWGHIKDKKVYISLLESYNISGKSMENFYLKGLDAPSMNLLRANLKNANLSGASLPGSTLADADLSGADFIGANLTSCDFIGTDCIETNFMMTNLSRSRFWHADLTKANLTEATLSSADFLNAVLFECNLYHADLREARFITKENFKGRNNSERVDEKGPKTARESYANLKQYFINAARYNDVSWASYNENRMELRRLWKEKRFGIIPFFVMGLLCGWGERPLRATVSAISIIIGYAAVFFFFNGIEPTFSEIYKPSFLDYVYYSTITFTTVGYGDFLPKQVMAYKLLAGSEAFIGVFMMGLFVFSLGRRYASR